LVSQCECLFHCKGFSSRGLAGPILGNQETHEEQIRASKTVSFWHVAGPKMWYFLLTSQLSLKDLPWLAETDS